MSNTNYIDFLVGEEGLNNRSALLRAFWCPSSHVPANKGLKEINAVMAAQYRHGGMSKISAKKGPAFIGIKAEFGTWEEVRLAVPTGQILKFQGKRSIEGNIEAFANIYISPRPAAALRECRLQLTHHSRSANAYAFIRGNFDILTADQVIAAGVFISQQFMPLADSGRVRAAFEDVIHEEEKAAVQKVAVTVSRPALASKHGIEVSVVKPVHEITKR